MSLFRQHAAPCAFPAEESWVILSPIEASIKRKIEAVGTPLSEWDIHIYRGVLTGCNEAFIIPTARRDEILAACRDEDERRRTAELIRPILRGRDIKRYGYEWAELWVIYIPWHFPMQFDESIKGASEKAEQAFREQYPAVYAHLLLYKEPLSKRNQAETGIRYEWYALQRWGANYWEDFEKPQILWIELSDEPKFCFAEKFVSLNTIFFLTGENIHHILGLLNSKLITWYFKHCIGTTSGVGTNRWLKYTIERLPIAGVDPRVEESATLLCEDATENREEIDYKLSRIVCELYKLTPEEIDFISNNVQ